jgi:hypothetical protein
LLNRVVSLRRGFALQREEISMRYFGFSLLSVLCGAVQAHHGPGQFDSSQPVEVTGVVTDIRYVNPHGYVYFDVTDDNGEVIPWRCELQAGSLLRRAGWTEDLFPIGGEITVMGDRGSREEHACALRTVILADGSTLDRYDQRRAVIDAPTSSAELLVDGELDLAGTWAAPQRNPDGGTGGGGMGMGMGMGMGGGIPGLELTAAGREAIQGVDAQIDNPRFHCMATNIFFDWEFDRHVNEILQTEDTITLKYGLMDIVRTIHLDMVEHPASITPSRAGHSIGRWEDGDLVVDTIGFEEGFLTVGGGGVVKHSREMHAVERFSYNAQTQGLTRTYSAEDPLYFTGQYTGQDTVFKSDVPFEPYACVELKDADL